MPTGGRSLFPPDRGLQVRMAVALLAFVLFLVAIVAVMVVLFEGVRIIAFLVFFWGFALVLGAGFDMSRKKTEDDRGRPPAPADVERLRALAERLAAMADVTVPHVKVDRSAVPLAWTVSPPFARSRLHLTTALIDTLSKDELSAVVAHELSHAANRDARTMTVLSVPGVFLLRGFHNFWHNKGKVIALFLGPVFIPIGVVFGLLARVVSRHREFSADRAAAAITGSPTALASALRRLSGDLDALPTDDLRVVAARDPLHILPARPQTGVKRLWATHPPLEARLDRLERLERGMHVPQMPAP